MAIRPRMLDHSFGGNAAITAQTRRLLAVPVLQGLIDTAKKAEPIAA
jgi:hypothetical protein